MRFGERVIITRPRSINTRECIGMGGGGAKAKGSGVFMSEPHLMHGLDPSCVCVCVGERA